MKTVAVLSLWRDSESYLKYSLAQFDAMESTLLEQDINVVYAFFENDSTDKTPQLLQSWLQDRVGFVISERIGAPKWGSVASLDRVRYQARYRNMALELVNNYYNFDYLLVVDSDVQWEPSLITGLISRLDDNEFWGMVSPNTVQNVRDFIEDTDRPSYFDSWSLLDSHGTQAMTFAANPFLTPEDRTNWDQGLPVSCNSAFGSIAMVKAEALDEVDWSVIDGVEHWEFCKGIRLNGYLVIADPSLHAEVVHKKEVIPHPDVVRLHQERLSRSLMATFVNN
jgi:GT2 family glycosyltransferase